MMHCTTPALVDAVCWCGARVGAWSLPPPLIPPSVRVEVCPLRVSFVLACWYATPDSLCLPRARSGCPSGARRMPIAWLCACTPAASAPPPFSLCAHTPQGPVAGGQWGQSMWFLPVCISGSGPLLRLPSVGGGGSSDPRAPLPVFRVSAFTGLVPVVGAFQGGWVYGGGAEGWGLALAVSRPVPARRGGVRSGHRVAPRGARKQPAMVLAGLGALAAGGAGPRKWAAQLSLHPPCTGTESGCHRCSVFMDGTSSILLRFVSACSRAPPEGGVPWHVHCVCSPRCLGGRAPQHVWRRQTSLRGCEVAGEGRRGERGGLVGASCLSCAPLSFYRPAVPLWRA